MILEHAWIAVRVEARELMDELRADKAGAPA
jgi:hypothetical protein